MTPINTHERDSGMGPTKTGVEQFFIVELPNSWNDLDVETLTGAYTEALAGIKEALPERSVWQATLFLPAPWLRFREMALLLPGLYRALGEIGKDDRVEWDIRFTSHSVVTLGVGSYSIFPDYGNPTGTQEFLCYAPVRHEDLALGVVPGQRPRHECLI